MFHIFIDGKEGTTGLQIFDRLENRDDIEIITLPEELRKDVNARRECINNADLAFLCLPDAAAIESVGLVDNPKVKIIDTSTAHRTNPEWTYGFPELSNKRRSEIIASNRVANPGCHATGFISIVAPLVSDGIVGSDYPFAVHSLTGYSGGGKKTIAQYQSGDRDIALSSPREYAVKLSHKHLPEMVNECGLKYAPIFNPIICDFYSGMCVTVPLFTRLMAKKYSVNDLFEYFTNYYATHKLIKIVKLDEVPDFIPSNEMSGSNGLKIYISGNSERIFIASVFDNLGKGASGAAVQNMNLMLGFDEYKSLL